MPRYREIFIKKDSKVIVWKISEKEEEFLTLLGLSIAPTKISKYRSPLHRCQYLATQILLKESHLLDVVFKDENGKPHIPNGYISISHDSNYVALMISKNPCGIDLQTITPKVLRVKHKFYDADDFPVFGSELAFYTKVWSIKEALYKVHGDPMVYFKEGLRINKMDAHSAKTCILHPDYKSDFDLQIQLIDDIYLVYTI